MGITFDRILDAFDGPFEKISDIISPPAGRINQKGNVAGYLLSHQINDSFVGTTKLLASGEEIYWLTDVFTANGKNYPEGTIYIPAKPSTNSQLQKLAKELGLDFDAISVRPKGDALKIRPVRVGLWDKYGGSMDSGWIRWLFEQAFPFPFEVVYPSTLNVGNLKNKYDILIFPSGAIPSIDNTNDYRRQSIPDNLPSEYKNRVENITVEKTIPQLRKFVEDGGVLLSIGSSTDIAYHFRLPITNALADIKADGSFEKYSQNKFFIPGSVLRVKVDNTTPVAYGITEDLDLIYRNNPVFRLLPDARQKGTKSIAWFNTPEPLRSGWAWGQHYLNGGVAIAETSLGKGKVFLFGPEITFRGQSHASFKFLFNAIYYSGAVPVVLR